MWVRLNPRSLLSLYSYPPPSGRCGEVSGLHWIMPNGRSGPGKVFTSPDVPMIGVTSAAGSSAAAAGLWGSAANVATTTATTSNERRTRAIRAGPLREGATMSQVGRKLGEGETTLYRHSIRVKPRAAGGDVGTVGATDPAARQRQTGRPA